ncbi:uncharacterized protein LOC144912863 [Branchiostoma floridae x Branchiostoma belcheri]
MATDNGDGNPDNHVYSCVDSGDIENQGQVGEDNGHCGQEEDSTIPKNVQRNASEVFHNPVYEATKPHAQQGKNKRSAKVLSPCLRSRVLRVIVATVTVTALLVAGVITGIHLVTARENTSNTRPCDDHAARSDNHTAEGDNHPAKGYN